MAEPVPSLAEPKAAARRRKVVVVYVAAALVGFLVGAQGLSPLALAPTSESLSPLARVGFALERDALPNDAAAYAQLGRDIESAAAAVPTTERGAFALVAAVRGLRSAGVPDWERATQLCSQLHWPRCDREALEELAKRSRP